MHVQVHAAIWVEDKLVVHRSMRQGRERITLPGGRVKARESIHDALRREVREEIRLEIEVGELLFAAEVLNLAVQHTVLIFDARIGGAVDACTLDLIEPGSPQADRVLPPVVPALERERAATNGRARWLGNLALSGSIGGLGTRTRDP